MKIEKKYELLQNVVLNESKAVWETSQLFLISNTILATIIGANFSNQQIFVPFLLSILGLIISVCWFFSCKRTSNYYKFRMAQITKLEEKISGKNNGLDIFAGEGKKVSEGKLVVINGETYSARVLGINIRSFSIIWIITTLFIVFFLLMSSFVLFRGFILNLPIILFLFYK